MTCNIENRDVTLVCGHLNESYREVHPCGVAYYTVQGCLNHNSVYNSRCMEHLGCDH